MGDLAFRFRPLQPTSDLFKDIQVVLNVLHRQASSDNASSIDETSALGLLIASPMQIAASNLPPARGTAQVVLGCRLLTQISESSVTKFLLHALPEFVRLAKETPGPSLLGSFALVVHVLVRSRAT